MFRNRNVLQEQGGRGRHQTPSEQILILNYRFLNFLNLSYPPPIFQYVIVVIKSNLKPNGTVLYDHVFIINIPGQKIPITLLYNHHESLINAAVLIGKIHKVRENKWTCSDVGDLGVMGHAARLVQAIDRQQSMESKML
jgi:hypothetical protein